MSTLFDTAVIGAGMAGLTAARDLAVQGKKVILLEARDRIGGRVYRKSALGGELEVGGGYMNWTQPMFWHELCKHGMAELNPPLESVKMYWLSDGVVYQGTKEEYLDSALIPTLKAFGTAGSLFPVPFDTTVRSSADDGSTEQLSVAEYLDQLVLTAHDRDIIEGSISGLIHSTETTGIAQVLHMVAIYGGIAGVTESAGVWSPKYGTKALADAILGEATNAGAELQLSTPVTAVEQDSAGVTITTASNHRVCARTAVLALPINTLQHVRVTPALPVDINSMLADGNPTHAMKLWVQVKGHIEAFSALAPPGKHPLNAIRAEKRWGDDTLIMCMVSDASAIDPTDLEAVAAALHRFRPGLEVIATAHHDWNADEYSQGGWMMHRPGHYFKGAVSIRKPHGRVCFAGSDIAALSPGYIEGAMSSGMEAAVNVTKLLHQKRTRSNILHL